MNNSESFISIIIPCYNSGEYLSETIESVIKQTHKNWECIIVDNGSTDNSKKIAQSIAEKDSRFISVLQPIKGLSSARNFGILHSKGKYILPLDSDDIIAPTYIQKAAKILDENEKLKVVYCEVDFFGEWSGKWNLPEFSIKQMLFENIIFCTALFRKVDYDKTAGYNEQMMKGYEDWDFWLSLISDESEVYRIPEILFHYRIRNKSMVHSLSDNDFRMLRKQLYENHRELYLSKLSISDLVYDYYLVKDTIGNYKNSEEYIWGSRILPIVKFIKRILFLS